MSRLSNDVGQVQQVVSETIGDLARETLALVGFVALLFYYDARLAIVCMTGAPLIVYPLIRLGQRVRRTTRQKSGSARAVVPPQRRSIHRPSHRESVRHGSLRSQKFKRAGFKALSHEHEGHGVSFEPSAADGASRRLRYGRRPLVWQSSDRRGPNDPGAFRLVFRRSVPDVRTREEAQSGQRQPPAGHRGLRTDFRAVRCPYRGEGAARRLRALAIPGRHRIPGCQLRLRRWTRAHPARRVVQVERDRWWPSSAAAAPGRPHS